ncbi:MAG: hemin uptake protein HemP [Planctomycetota bacterium]
MTKANEATQRDAAAAPPARVLDSSELFSGQKTVLIRHHEEFYRLLLTKNGKLILQK